MPRNIVFCGTCAGNKGIKKPVVRVTQRACDYCGSWDAIRKRTMHPRTGEVKIEKVKLRNFEQDARFIPDTPEESNLQRSLGEA